MVIDRMTSCFEASSSVLACLFLLSFYLRGRRYKGRRRPGLRTPGRSNFLCRIQSKIFNLISNENNCKECQCKHLTATVVLLTAAGPSNRGPQIISSESLSDFVAVHNNPVGAPLPFSRQFSPTNTKHYGYPVRNHYHLLCEPTNIY